jgi:hypothetical protein
VEIAHEHEHGVLDRRRARIVLERELAGDSSVVPVNHQEGDDEERDQQQHAPGTVRELGHADHHHDDSRGAGAHRIEPPPPPPPLLAADQPAPRHSVRRVLLLGRGLGATARLLLSADDHNDAFALVAVALFPCARAGGLLRWRELSRDDCHDRPDVGSAMRPARRELTRRPERAGEEPHGCSTHARLLIGAPARLHLHD